MMRLATFLGLLAMAGCALSPAVPAYAQSERQDQAPTAYQGPDLDAQRAAIARLAPLIGRWEGQAQLHSPREMMIYQSEEVRAELNGLLLVIHGRGYSSPQRTGSAAFEAFAVISYDEREGRYAFRSYAMGYSTTAVGEFLSDGAFRWSFSPGGPVQIRYTLWFDESSWRETGEMSYDGGSTWRESINMTLERAPH